MPGKLVIKKGNPLKKTKNTFFLEMSVCQLEVFWCQAQFYQLTLNTITRKKEKEQRRTKMHALVRGIEKKTHFNYTHFQEIRLKYHTD